MYEQIVFAVLQWISTERPNMLATTVQRLNRNLSEHSFREAAMLAFDSVQATMKGDTVAEFLLESAIERLI